MELLCDPIDSSPPGSPSLGFSRQERWRGLPFPSPTRESEATQLCPTLSDPMDCSLPGSSVHGIFQARVLEWGAIALSTQFLDQGSNLGSHSESTEAYPLDHQGFPDKSVKKKTWGISWWPSG